MTSPGIRPNRKRLLPKGCALLLLLLSAWLSPAFAQQLPSKPKEQTVLYDRADLLNSQAENALRIKLLRYYDSTSTQIVILTLNSIGEDDINLFAAELAQKWGIGQRGKDNGILILVDKEHRKIAVQNGYGIEYLLTDALSRQLIEKDIVPNFKRGDFYTGLDQLTDDIFKVLEGNYKAPPPKGDKSGGSAFSPLLFLLFLFIVLFYARSKGGRGGKGGGGRRGPDAGDLFLTGVLLSGLGRGFGNGGGFGGGFGGGGFGGGGASGSW